MEPVPGIRFVSFIHSVLFFFDKKLLWPFRPKYLTAVHRTLCEPRYFNHNDSVSIIHFCVTV